MPVYEYQCKACGNIHEAFQKISEAPLDVCPKCNGSLKKLISHSSFHLKGSGWYVTDYGGSKSGAKSSGDTPAKSASKSEKSASKSSDSK